MKERKVWFRNSKGQKLCGLLSLQKIRTPAIILVHGMMPRTDKHEYGLFDELSKKLFSNGFSVFRFDFHGHGESQGDYKDVRLAREVDDLKHAIDFFTKQKIDAARLGLLSTSFGAASTILLADKRIKAIQLTSPFCIWNEQSYKILFRNCGPEWKSEMKKFGYTILKRFCPSDVRRQKIGKKFFEDAKKVNLIKEVRKVKVPIFIIGGGKDRYVNKKYLKLLYHSANKPKKIKIVNFADHNLYGSPKEKKILFNDTIKWFKQNM